MKGEIYKDLRVGMRMVHLKPTVKIVGGERIETPNAPVYIYDTSGPYSDPNIEIDLKRGLPHLRQAWIDSRKEGDTQMSLARQGVITQEMEYVAIRENMNCRELGIETRITPEFVRDEVAAGRHTRKQEASGVGTNDYRHQLPRKDKHKHRQLSHHFGH